MCCSKQWRRAHPSSPLIFLEARRFDWPTVAAEVLSYYEEVLERREAEPVTQRVRFARVKRVAGKLIRV